MSRKRMETISPLGRAPARRSALPTPAPSPTPPLDPAPPLDGLTGARPRFSLWRWTREALTANLGLKLLAAMLAVTLYLLVNSDREREITAKVGVSYTLPDDRVLVSDRIDEVRITVRGPYRRLRKFDERQLERVHLDVRSAADGDLVLSRDMVSVPSGLTVTSIVPRSVRVRFERRVEKRVEVALTIAGQPAHGYIVAGHSIEPAHVMVRGPEGLMRAITGVRTEAVRVDGRDASFVANAPLWAPEGIEFVGSATASARVQIAEELASQRIAGVAITVRGDGVDPNKVRLATPKADVILTGPVLDIERARKDLKLFITVSPTDVGKTRTFSINVEGVPAGVGAKLATPSVSAALRR